MNNYGKLIDSNTLQFERVLPGSRERVWQYLVDAEKRSLWFAGGPTDLSPNGRMELHFHNSTLSEIPDPTPEKYQEYGDGYQSFATILEVKEPELLKIKWEEGLVTFSLEDLGNGETKLTLTHERLQDTDEYKIGTLAGWHTHLDILSDHFHGAEIKGFWKVHMQLEEEYTGLLPKA